MKFYVICVILLCSPAAFAAVLSSDVPDILDNYLDDCIKESGADASIVESARRAVKIPNDGRLDTFTICMLKKLNVLHKDNSVNQDIYSYTIISDSLREREISNRCKTERGKDVGETARKIMNCLLEA